MKRLINILVVVVLVAGICISKSGTVHAANVPFTCSSNFYQVLNGQLMLLNPTTGVYTNIGSNAGFQYNAIGYNTQDNYIYGFDYIGGNVGDLIRVASDGTTTDLGVPTGMPVGAYYNGSFDLAGNLYVMTDVHTIYKVDVNTVSATALTISGSSIVGTDNVFINNKLYFLSGTSLTVVDLSNDSATTTTVNGPAGWTTSSIFFGAGWADQAGDLFFANNGTGSIYQITDYDSSSPSATFKIAGATVASSNDGANCSLAPQNPFDPPVATNDAYTTPFNTPLHETSAPILGNDLGSSLTVTSNTSPSHGTVSINPDGTFLYTPNTGYSGTDSFNYTITDTFGRTASATVTITISPASAIKAPNTGFGVHPMPNPWITIGIYSSISASLVGLGVSLRKIIRTARLRIIG